MMLYIALPYSVFLAVRYQIASNTIAELILVYIIESVDSISRDGPDIHIIQHKISQLVKF